MSLDAGGGNGVAIGLAPKYFGFEKKEDYNPEEKTYLEKVEYAEPAAKIRHAAILDSAVQTVTTLGPEGP